VITQAHGVLVIERFMRSLDNLRQGKLHGLLVHRGALLSQPGAQHIVDALHALRDQKLVSRIGVSVYDGTELNAVEAGFDFDIVQLPVSIADQRLVRSGHLTRLKRRGVEIHARSVFLQGLLLMDPATLCRTFSPVAPLLERFALACRSANCSPLEACLQFVLGLEAVDHLVVGVNAVDELAATIAACRAVDRSSVDFADLAFDQPRFLNPALWAHLH
jgi:aryl-alcohol dehydrogenase-like predicted oxidoreductase